MELYPASAHGAFHGTSIQYPQEIDQAVQHIYGACKGLGTDEKTLITVLGSKSPETRNLIALRYKELYQQPLKSLLKSETSGDFGRLLRMISTPLPETEAQILRDATKGMGTTESLIVQILSGRTNEEMNILKRTYFDLVGKDLAVTLNSELSGDFRKVVMAVLQSAKVPYNPAVHNAAKAEEEAIALYKAGQGRLGTNEEVFIGILVKAPPEFLQMMDAVYVAKYNNNIAKAVDKEFSGDAKKSLNYLVRATLDPYPAIAEIFEKTMKGFGTDETGLSTALVRYQSLLPHVKAAYKRLYHEELRDRIAGETSGDYKKLLLEMYDAPQDLPKMKTSSASGAAVPAGLSGAHTNAGPPAYLQAQSSYAASSTSLQSSGQGGHSVSSSYPTPPGQQTYGQSPQSTPGQALYGTAPHQTPTSQSGGYPTPTPTSQPSTYSPSGNNYPAQGQSQDQTSGYPAPGYPTQQQPQHQHYPPHGQQPPNQPPGHQQQPPTQPYQQYPPGQQQQQQQQQQPPTQQYPQYPVPGNQNQPHQQYSTPPGHQQQPSGQQYPVPGQPLNQTYQQYPVPGQQQASSQPYQQYPVPGVQQPYQQYGAPSTQQQAPNQQYQQYGAQPASSQQYQQYGAPNQQQTPSQQYQPSGHQPNPSYQQYPAPGQQPQPQYGAPPQQPGYPSQPQSYQQYGAPPQQQGYQHPPPQQHGGYPPPHQPQYPSPGYPSYRGV
ncbi:Annexin A7 [Phytophthora citrophthora]|uniref:Annexin n=1 Tax=Phytophthora citrophthora TaxID=4793 RepID=A0AAD9G244_9STRA|nr:Annexin A7 [Phytophthora citrophthora]